VIHKFHFLENIFYLKILNLKNFVFYFQLLLNIL